MIRTRGTESHMLQRKLHSGTSKTKQPVPVNWKSHCATCVPAACVILYHLTGSDRAKGLMLEGEGCEWVDTWFI